MINYDKLENLLNELQSRATVRTISVEDIRKQCKEVENFIISKNLHKLNGLEFEYRYEDGENIGGYSKVSTNFTFSINKNGTVKDVKVNRCKSGSAMSRIHIKNWDKLTLLERQLLSLLHGFTVGGNLDVNLAF